jgi:hypothetical protein
MELRQEFIHSHAIVLCALGSMGQTMISANPDDWKIRLGELRKLDWRRTNNEWQGVAMSGSDVVNRRQNRMDTASYLKLRMGLQLTPQEERSLKGATDVSKGTLTPGKLGKNGDQIQRLFESPADVFFVQYHGQIDESVVHQMKKMAIANSVMEDKQIWYGVIDGDDTNRLLAAYPKQFKVKD